MLQSLQSGHQNAIMDDVSEGGSGPGLVPAGGPGGDHLVMGRGDLFIAVGIVVLVIIIVAIIILVIYSMRLKALLV